MIELTSQEFSVLVQLAAKAPCIAGDSTALGPVFIKAVAMVNSTLSVVCKTPDVALALQAQVVADTPVVLADASV